MPTDPELPPSAVVEQQKEAYNDGDIDAFVDWYAEQAVITDLDDGTVIAEGRDEIYNNYAELFETASDLTAEVIDEFSIGGYVAIKERASAGGDSKTALAVYRVQDGEISHLWLGDE